MLQLERRHVDAMVAHALREDPNECCGILAAREGRVARLYPMSNVEHSPYRYSMDPRELYHTYREIEDNGWEVLAIYHSHTHTPAYPSATDVRLASWPEAFYLLVSLMDRERPAVRAFRIANGEVKEEELLVVEE
ncbi:MAG: M67 family metallopeptidase [Chloroflexi bacterium]|nr:M67 family metallopeptidase [Chloroflexota bacterium]